MVCLSKQHDFSYEDSVQEKSAIWLKFRYQRDPIGNRITSTTSESGSPVIRNYTSNNLNQYTAIDNPASTPTYDFDGNTVLCPLSSGVWSFTWDANNQMKSSEKADQRLEYLYDSSGRRAMKKVFSGSVGSWSLNTDLRFVYDGYKLIEVLDGQNSNAIKQKITWNGETPFSIYDSALNQAYYYVLDANKNVSELIDASGNVVAHYEYSPFGKIVSQSGTYADENPFRFSSEYFDKETGLVYYNFRYYNPEMGRWLSREPIGERGSINLYRMCHNNPIYWWDHLGLEDNTNNPNAPNFGEDWKVKKVDYMVSPASVPKCGKNDKWTLNVTFSLDITYWKVTTLNDTAVQKIVDDIMETIETSKLAKETVGNFKKKVYSQVDTYIGVSSLSYALYLKYKYEHIWRTYEVICDCGELTSSVIDYGDSEERDTANDEVIIGGSDFKTWLKGEVFRRVSDGVNALAQNKPRKPEKNMDTGTGGPESVRDQRVIDENYESMPDVIYDRFSRPGGAR